jgi:hypothetical protein
MSMDSADTESRTVPARTGFTWIPSLFSAAVLLSALAVAAGLVLMVFSGKLELSTVFGDSLYGFCRISSLAFFFAATTRMALAIMYRIFGLAQAKPLPVALLRISGWMILAALSTLPMGAFFALGRLLAGSGS